METVKGSSEHIRKAKESHPFYSVSVEHRTDMINKFWKNVENEKIDKKIGHSILCDMRGSGVE